MKPPPLPGDVPIDPTTGRPYFEPLSSGWADGWKPGPVSFLKFDELPEDPWSSLAQRRDDSVWQQALDTMRADVSARMDTAIKQALDDALGAGRWTPEAIAHRCSRMPGNWPTGDTYMLDGCPLLRFDFVPEPLDYENVSRTVEFKMNVVRFEWKPL